MVYAIFALPSYLQRHSDILGEFIGKHGLSRDDLKRLPSDAFLQREMNKMNEEEAATATATAAAAEPEGVKKDN